MLLADDDVRVKLQNGDNDFINASPVRFDGPGFSLKYIASQGPKDVSDEDDSCPHLSQIENVYIVFV